MGSKAEVVYASGNVGDPTGEYNGVKTGQDLKDNRSEDELLAEALQDLPSLCTLQKQDVMVR